MRSDSFDGTRSWRAKLVMSKTQSDKVYNIQDSSINEMTIRA